MDCDESHSATTAYVLDRDAEAEMILHAYHFGWSRWRLAKRFNRTTIEIKRILDRGRRLARIELVFPINVFAPSSKPTPIRHGDCAMCMVSNMTGFEDHPALARNPRTDPKPENRAYRPNKLKGGI